MTHSGYYIDERGILSLRSYSYPDSVEQTYHVKFDADDVERQFEAFLQMVLRQGREQRSRELFSILREGTPL